MHVGFGWAKPWLPHALDGPVTLSTSCWSIWPAFSGNVMAPSKAFTRAWIGLSASSHGVCGELAATPWARKADSPPTTKTPTATAMTALRRPLTRPLKSKFDMTRPPWVADQPHVGVLVGRKYDISREGDPAEPRDMPGKEQQPRRSPPERLGLHA